MKRVLLALAAALPLASCAGYYGGGYSGYYGGGAVAYDGFYDDYYGPIYDGYWGNDGFFYYRSGDHDRRFRRGDPAHFLRGPGGPGGFHGDGRGFHGGDGFHGRPGGQGGNFHPMQGQFTPGRGMSMPHFGGPGGGGGVHGGGHGGHR